MAKEGLVEKAVQQWFNDHSSNTWLQKTQSNKYAKIGLPDFVGVYDSKPIAIETKAGNGHILGMEQLVTGLRFVRAGGIYVVAYPDFIDLDITLTLGQQSDLLPLLANYDKATDLPRSTYAKFEIVQKEINKTKQTIAFLP